MNSLIDRIQISTQNEGTFSKYEDRDVLIWAAHPNLSDSLIIRYLEEAEARNMPRDKAMEILAHMNYDVDCAVKFCDNFVVPDLMCDMEKQIFCCAIDGERMRMRRRTRRMFKMRLMKRLLPQQPQKSLMHYYYKNKKLDFDFCSRIPATSHMNKDLFSTHIDSSKKISHHMEIRTNKREKEDNIDSNSMRSNLLSPLNFGKRNDICMQSTSVRQTVEDKPTIPIQPRFRSVSVISDISRSQSISKWNDVEITVLKHCLHRYGTDYDKIADVIGGKTSDEVQRYSEMVDFFGIRI